MANEAGAFGFGVLVWTLLFGAGATYWFFPEHYMAAAVLAVWVLAVAGLTSLYARRLGVTFSARLPTISSPVNFAGVVTPRPWFGGTGPVGCLSRLTGAC